MFFVSFRIENCFIVSFTSKMSIFSQKFIITNFLYIYYILEHYDHNSEKKDDFQNLPMDSKNGHL